MWIQFYIEDTFPSDRAAAYLKILPRLVFLLRWVEVAPTGASHSVSFSLYDLVKEGIFDVMPRTKRTTTTAAARQPNQETTFKREAIAWANVRLTEDDLAYLSEQDTTQEKLGAMLLGVADRGYGFSVKRMDGGETFCCTITGQCDDDINRSMGVSGFSTTAGDAVLGCLYKFEQKLGGIFLSDYLDGTNDKPRFR